MMIECYPVHSQIWDTQTAKPNLSDKNRSLERIFVRTARSADQAEISKNLVLGEIGGSTENQPVRSPVVCEEKETTRIAGTRERLVVEIGRSVENRPVISLVIGEGNEITLIIATIHGNENAGTPLVWSLAKHLLENPHLLDGRKAILVPLANPDGFSHKCRYNANNVDLNRNFDTANRRNNRRNGAYPLSEPEAYAIEQVIKQYRPKRIISIHQPFGCIDFDGPASKLARRIAQYCKLPVRNTRALPGSLGSYAGVDLGIPTVTLELPEGAERLAPEDLWELYGTALLVAIMYPEFPTYPF